MSFIKAITARGYKPETLRAKFEKLAAGAPAGTTDSGDDDLKKLQGLVDRHQNLVRQGIDSTYDRARSFSAIDKCIDVVHEGTATTLLRSLRGANPNSQQVLEYLMKWDLTRVIEPELDSNNLPKKDTNGAPKMRLNIPLFAEIVVPLAASYAKSRWGAIWSQLNSVPLYSYPPSVPTLGNHLACKLITQEIQASSEAFGHRDMERDQIWPTLLYSYNFAFADAPFKEKKYPWTNVSGEYEVITLADGITWVSPHPSKVFYDRSVPMRSYNTDSGGRYGGYWSVVPFLNLPEKIWNRDRISMSGSGSSSWFNLEGFNSYSYFYPCSVKPPPIFKREASNDRESRYYTSAASREDTVQLVTIYEKIVPKDWGLYDVDIPVWHRFLYAGDGVVIDCVPYAYNPISVSTDSIDPERDRNSSLALELIPYQDQIARLLMNIVFILRNNAANLTFFNKDAVGPGVEHVLSNWGDNQYAKLNFAPYSPRALKGPHDTTPGELFSSVKFPQSSLNEAVVAVNLLLQLMERILGFSAQEVGAQASHEQSSAEVRVIGQSTSNRIGLTMSGLMAGRAARAKAAYDAWLEYSKREIDTELSGIDSEMMDALKSLGFEVKPISKDSVKITGPRMKLDLSHLSASRAPSDLPVDARAAAQMMQSLQMLLSSPEVVAKVGVNYILDRYNQLLTYAGVPNDWRFERMPGAQVTPTETQQIVEFVKQSLDQLQSEIQSKVVQPIGEAIKQGADRDAELVKGLETISGQVQEVGQRVATVEQATAQVVASQQSQFVPAS